jgi:hypothetical protein
MIILLIILIIIFLLLIITIGVSRIASESKQRYIKEYPAKYYLDAGVLRIFWGIVTLIIGIGFPPLWILTLFLFGYGIYCFAMVKKLKRTSMPSSNANS